MNKQELEDKLSNGEVCGDCPCHDYCGELNFDCVAIEILKEITGYPSFDNSVIKNCDIEKQKVKE